MLRFLVIYFNVASTYLKMLLEPIVRNARFRWVLLAVIAIIFATSLYFGLYLDSFHLSKTSIFKHRPSNEPEFDLGLPWPAAPQQIWRALQPMLDGNAPDVKSPDGLNKAISEKYNGGDVDDTLKDALSMPSKDVLRMRDLHQKFVANMTEKLPSFLPTQGAPKRGIVTVAGGYHFPIFFVSLRMLRRTGSTLPVEVFLPSEEDYEKEICEEVLPQYNAKCVTLTSIFDYGDGTHKPNKDVVKFQYKIFSILFSSFEEILFLDSDSFPIENPDPLFDSEPFRETGMITWPDVWAISTSPLFYLITSQTPPRVSERASMESGQLLISKKKHHQTLILASYYNYHGPFFFYDLLCQGGAGKGDKETFHPAALALGLPFYAVSEPVRGVGHAKNNPSQFYIFAMIQHDPLQDYERVKHGHTVDKPRPFFVHANTPKWNAKNVLDKSPPYMLTKNINMEDSPAYVVPEDAVAEIPYVEKHLWEETLWVGCELETKFKDFQEKLPGICARLQEYFDNVLRHRPDFQEDSRPIESNSTEAARVRPRVFTG